MSPPPVVRCEREEGQESPSWPPERPFVLFASNLCANAVPYAMHIVHLVVAAEIWHTMICAWVRVNQSEPRSARL